MMQCIKTKLYQMINKNTNMFLYFVCLAFSVIWSVICIYALYILYLFCSAFNTDHFPSFSDHSLYPPAKLRALKQKAERQILEQ